MRMTFYTANCRGNAKNSLYPNRRVIDNEDDCMEVVAFDHVCAEFRNCRRSGDNFLSCDVDVMDCDNSHSDNPEDWIHPEYLEEKVGADVAFAVVPSRNNMKPKEGKSARPRFHVYFPHDPVTDGEACAALKKAIQQKFPFFDAKALDSARFIFGHPADSMVKEAVSGVASDLMLQPQAAAVQIQGGGGASGDSVRELLGGLREMLSGLQEMAGGGTICIPVYVGGTLLDEVVVDAQARQNLRSGGR